LATRSAPTLPSTLAEGRQELKKNSSAAFGILSQTKCCNAKALDSGVLVKSNPGESSMKNNLLKLAIKLRILLDEEAQDLIEYALVVALIAFSATAGMSSLAAAINNAFNNVGNTLGTYIT
jgi:pilus assembly protein Flp/PilA